MTTPREERRAALIRKFKDVGAERVLRISVCWQHLEQHKGGAASEHSTELLSELHTLKGEAKTLGFHDVHALAHGLETVLFHARDRDYQNASAIAGRVGPAIDALGLLLSLPAGAPPVAVEALLAALDVGDAPPAVAQQPMASPAPVMRSTMRVPTARVVSISDAADDLRASHAKAGFHTRQLTAGLAAAELPEDQLRALQQQIAALTETLYLHGLALKSLDRTARELRLLPFSTILAPYLRMVRGLAAEQGKQAILELSGEETEADKRVLEVLEEPLLHLLRNAVDHGIELPAERLAAGKRAEGTIRITARAAAGVARVTVEDDGRGLVPEALKARAIERGLVSREAATAMTDDQARALIFLAGFTTRAEVTATSGRGVGLDVVKRKVEQIGGRVTLGDGPGLKVELAAPISISVTRGLVIENGAAPVVLPVGVVDEIRDTAALPVAQTHDGPMVRLGGALLPVASLAEGLTRSPRPPTRADDRAVIVHAGSKRAALTFRGRAFDADLVVKPVGRPLADHAIYTGAAVLDDGRLALVLDVVGLLEAAPRPAPQRTARRVKARLLLVDDSPIFRETVGEICLRLGHDVTTVCDGVEALDALAGSQFDLVITDINMPRLDGLELLAQVRSHARTKELPMVVLTTLGSAEDKSRAVQAGANAYLVKAELSDEAVATTLSRFLQ